MMTELRYASGVLKLTLPDTVVAEVIRKPPMPVIQDEHAAAASAFDNPVRAAALAELARRASSACIAICDITRPVPNAVFLPGLVDTLVSEGMSPDAITILIATGLHRPATDEEIKLLVSSPELRRSVRIINHDARNDADHVDLGTTSVRRTRVRIDRRFVDADLRIATGLVEPHFMAGYSGGRKVIAPGLAHAETITTFHNSAFMQDPAARSCHLDDNPLHEEQLEIVRMLGGAYAVNTVIDEDRRLSFINFGEIIGSHAQAVDFVKDYCRVSVPRRFQTVITSAAGFPLD